MVVFGSVKASPGVTTTAVGVAAAWPDPRWTPVIECDPSGGDLAADFGGCPDPGLVGLATALRRDPAGVDVLSGHTQRLGLSFGRAVDAVFAPAAAAVTRAAIEVITAEPRLPAIRGAGGTVAMVDCGRLDERSPAAPLLAAADAVVVVTRPRLAELAHLSAEAPRLRHLARGAVLVVMVGSGFPPGEVADAVGLPVAAVVPVDLQAGAALRGGARMPRRSSLPGGLTQAGAAIAAAVSHATVPTPLAPAPPMSLSPVKRMAVSP